MLSINSVIRSLKFRPGDVIYVLDIAYGSVKKLVSFVAEQCGATVVVGKVPSSALKSQQSIVDIVRDTLPASGVKLAVFDHVTSNTALVLPVKELTALCHERGARVLIDGAHALGMLDLDIPAIGADYYVR